MPTYEYACTVCAEQIEVVQRFSDDSLTVCPACGGMLRKVYSPVGIVFKGSGFYRTDSRKAPVVPAEDKGSAKDVKAKGSDSSPAEKNGSSSASSSDSGSSSDAKKSDSGTGKSGSSKSGTAAKSSQPGGAGSSTKN